MQIQPESSFTIFREIGDHTDTSRDTYYVVAKIRNSSSSQLYDTLTLVSQGNGEYKKDWQVIPCTHPDGTWINIKTTVYTDAGLTTKSTKYSEMVDSYLVKPFNMHGGGGGWVDVDYKRIQKMIDDSIKKIVFPEIKFEQTDLRPIEKELEDMKEDLKEIQNIDHDVISEQLLDMENNLHLKLDLINESINNK